MLKKGLIFIPKTHPVFHGTFVGFSKLTRFHQEGKEKWSNVLHSAVRMFLFLTIFLANRETSGSQIHGNAYCQEWKGAQTKRVVVGTPWGFTAVPSKDWGPKTR